MKNRLLTLLALHLGLAAVVAQPVITNQPVSQTALAGATVTFSVGATGAPPLSYQWVFNSLANRLPGATNDTLILPNVQTNHAGTYRVTITNAAGSGLLSGPGRLTVVTPPSITPVNPTATLFADVTLYATNGSGAPLSYQWLFNGTPIAGAVTNRLVVTNVQQTNAGAAYAVVSTYSFGSVTSQVATLTIAPFTITPANPTASLFADVTLLFTNRLGTPLAYQWFFNGEPIGGAVTNGLVLTNVQKTNAGNYAIGITYAFGSVTSQVATLKIVPFDSMYCFGFSWTDTYNCAANWPPPSWYKGRACNGPMWPEFLSTNLGMSYVESNNYAFCGALSSDELNQVTVRLRVPRKPELSLYCLWEGGSDFNFGNVDPTNVVAWNQTIQTALRNNSNAVHRLYELGARAILFQSQPGTNDLDLVYFDVYRAGLIDRYLKDFNARFVTAMDSFSRTHHDVRFYFVDLYSLWDEISTHPDVFGFTQIARDALGDANLTDKSFTGPGADYLLWNPSHPTSKFHKLLASRHLESLTNALLERLEAKLANTSATIDMSHLLIGRDYTLQSSSDLASWNDVQTFTASAGTNQVSQPVEAGARSVFYRLQWQR